MNFLIWQVFYCILRADGDTFKTADAIHAVWILEHIDVKLAGFYTLATADTPVIVHRKAEE